MGRYDDADGSGGASRRALSPYETTVRDLSDRLVNAQRPLRILDAVRWHDDVERSFFAAHARELPPVTRDSYASRPLLFHPDAKRDELKAIEGDVRRRLGTGDAVGGILTRMCSEYRAVVDLLTHRGTPTFAVLSERLYGSAADPTLTELRQTLTALLDHLAPEARIGQEQPTLDARQTAAVLSERLAGFFPEAGTVRVRVAEGIAADAAACCRSIKLRADARFTPREVRVLEVHEGWVHMGTTLNGRSQPVCTFLSKGPPSSTTTQEGLAVLTEVLAFASHPARLRRLTHRIEGVVRAGSGANFLEVYRFFLGEGYGPHESYHHTMRVFRGSLPQGCGPFTKDLCYSRGFVRVARCLRQAVSRGRPERIRLLFCGKTHLGDLKALAQLADEGLVAPPRCLPPPFADLRALSARMGGADFLGGAAPQSVEEDCAALL